MPQVVALYDQFQLSGMREKHKCEDCSMHTRALPINYGWHKLQIFGASNSLVRLDVMLVAVFTTRTSFASHESVHVLGPNGWKEFVW